MLYLVLCNLLFSALILLLLLMTFRQLQRLRSKIHDLIQASQAVSTALQASESEKKDRENLRNFLSNAFPSERS